MKKAKKKSAAERPPLEKTRLVVGRGGLEILTPDGTVLLELAPLAGGAELRVPGRDDADVRLVSGSGFSGLLVRRGQGAPITLYASDAEGGSLSLRDGAGGIAVSAQATEEGGRLDAWGPGGIAASVKATAEEGGLVDVHAPDGRLLAGMAARPAGGFFSAWNRAGKAVALLGSEKDGGTLSVTNEAGARVFVVPAPGLPPRLVTGGLAPGPGPDFEATLARRVSEEGG